MSRQSEIDNKELNDFLDDYYKRKEDLNSSQSSTDSSSTLMPNSYDSSQSDHSSQYTSFSNTQASTQSQDSYKSCQGQDASTSSQNSQR